MASTGIAVQITVETLACPNCGTWFGVDEVLLDRFRSNGRDFHCPNGHTMSYHDNDRARLRKARTELEKANARIEREHRRLVEETERREAAERSASALRGVVTKTKRRVGNGVCPCCGRTFQQLARHMHAKHPEYAESDS